MVVRDDFEACLQAYRFAELLLGGFADKSARERAEALQSAERLRDEVQTKFEMLTTSDDNPKGDALRAARSRLEQKLSDARSLSSR